MTGAEQLRIMHVVCTDAFAGVERHVAQLAAAESDAGHVVAAIGGAPDRMASAIARPDVLTVPAKSVRDAIREVNVHPSFDVVNVHMTAAEIAVSLSIGIRRAPIVSTRHFAARRGSTLLRKTVASLAARRIDAQLAVSDFVAQHIDGKSTVVHTGVPDRPDAAGPRGRQPVVLLVQRLEREKHTEVAIEAFAASGLSSEGWRLRIAGDGALRPKLERMAADLAVDGSVDFLGYRTDIEALMDQAAVFFASRPDEAYGLSVLEAMASGLPVIATGAGGHLETVGSVENAALFPPGDTEAAGKLLADLAGDEVRRANYGRELQKAQRTRFTLKAQQRATEAVYRRVL